MTALAEKRAPYVPSEAEERRFHFEMAALCSKRGLLNLSRSHSLAAGLFQSQEVREANLARCKLLEAEDVGALWNRWHPEGV